MMQRIVRHIKTTSRSWPAGDSPLTWLGVALAAGAISLCPPETFGQRPPWPHPPVHYYHQGLLSPGLIGQIRLQQGGAVLGYFQPVTIKTPPGAKIAFAEMGTFGPSEPGSVTVGLLVGSVYRIRITEIPLWVGQEVFPTIEIIDRLYTPLGLEWRYPIQIDLTLEDLQLALQGKFITRVVYLEEPKTALPVAQAGEEQSWFEVPPGADPLAVADQLGRPVAILRLGGRVPSTDPVPPPDFLFGFPPVLRPASLPADAPANPMPQSPGPSHPQSPGPSYPQSPGSQPVGPAPPHGLQASTAKASLSE